jgi:uncharacterized protein (TIGR02246 family)
VGVDPSTESEIRRTLTRYCQRCDDGDFAAWAQLFEPDATFSVLGATHEGREAIRVFIEAAQPPEARGKHVIAQSDIDLHANGDEATVVTDYLFLSRARQVTSAGRYHDRLRRGDDGEWRFVSREIRFL